MAVTVIDKTIMNQQVCIWSLAVKYVHLFASWEILHGKALTTVFSHNITCSYLRKIVRLLKLVTKSRNLLAWGTADRDATTGFPAKWRLRGKRRVGNLLQPIRNTTQIWRVISMEFLRSFLRRHFAGKPVVASRNVGCFLRLLKLAVSGNLSKFKQ